MIRPELYSKLNGNQTRDTQKALQDFANIIQWRSDGCDSILDAGCGPGDVTAGILMPTLPKNFSRLVGVDISSEMINYARKTWTHPKLLFEQFDTCADLEKQPFCNSQPFDHIFSFFLLMWVPNLRKCIQNFYKLLVSKGDILLLFIGNHTVYDAYKEQSFDKKWAKYMQDVDEKVSL